MCIIISKHCFDPFYRYTPIISQKRIQEKDYRFVMTAFSDYIEGGNYNMRICAQCQSTVNWSKNYCPLCSAPMAQEEQKTEQPAVNAAPPLNTFAENNQPSEPQKEQMDQPMELKAQIPIPTQRFNHNETPPPIEKGQQPAPKLTVGSVLKQTYATLRRNPAVFFGLGLINAIFFTLGSIIKETVGTNAAGPVFLVSLVVMMLINAAFTYASVQTLRGNPVTFGASLSRGASHFFTLLFAGFLIILISIAILILSGLIAWFCTFISKLIIGTVPLGRSLSLFPLLSAVISLILFLVLFISITLLAPACVVEGLGAVQSIKRSAALTQNYRLKIFGIFMATMAIFGTIGFIIGFIGGILDSILFTHAKVAAIASESLSFLISSTFSAVMFPVIYCKLREIKEGTAIESLAKVFD